MEGYIDIKNLTLEELSGIVAIYPWFSLARKELCVRMCGAGGWSDSQWADAAIYMNDRKVLADLLRNTEKGDWSDRNISEFLEKCVSGNSSEAAGPKAPRVHVVGGDYFTKDEYEKVRKSDDNVFSLYASGQGKKGDTAAGSGQEFEFCTETLAEIYAEQGYYDEAKAIYSKLILAYPEKNIYFAALIEKLNQQQNLEN